METDAVEHEILWKDGRNLAALLGQQAKLRLRLVRVELYRTPSIGTGSDRPPPQSRTL